MKLFRPMLAKTRDKPFDSPEWIFEAKWDGVRAIAYINDTLEIRSRNNEEILNRFPELVEIKELAQKVVLDGEIVVLKRGRIDFQAVLRRFQATNQLIIEKLSLETPATYVVFDILEAEGKSMVDIPLTKRKEILEKSVKEGRHFIKNVFVADTGIRYFQAVQRHGLEGIVAKKKKSLYQEGARSNDWLKIKLVKTCDCVVFGYTPGGGSRSKTFGSLLLGVYDENEPVYIGRVGTGFNQKELGEIRMELDENIIDEPWFDAPDIPKGSTWVRPIFVAIIKYQEYTKDNRLRMPSFQGFRTDKPPQLCSIAQLRPQTLGEYYAKRDFKFSPEPLGMIGTEVGNSFVVQEHSSRRKHWDFRIQRNGVMWSWAIPKGIPETTGIRRLAIKTEDHPIEYNMFEGTIPMGQYGAGTVEIWDQGFYVPVKWENNKIEIVLAGERLHGRFELVKLYDNEKNEWLFFKKTA